MIYVVVGTVETYEKACRLVGFKENNGSFGRFLIIDKEEVEINHIQDYKYLTDKEKDFEITIKDFLALPEPKKLPTHEEIMTKWWKCEEDWLKVFSYTPKHENPYGIMSAEPEYHKDYQPEYRSWVDKKFFAGKESVDIPPEVE